MPFVSDRQRRFMWAVHPGIARRWSAEGNGGVVGKSNGLRARSRVKRAKGGVMKTKQMEDRLLGRRKVDGPAPLGRGVRRGVRRAAGGAEDDATNPATGRPYWDESARGRRPGDPRRVAEDSAINPRTGRPMWDENAKRRPTREGYFPGQRGTGSRVQRGRRAV